MKISTAHKIGRFFQYFVLILVGIIMIYPLVWMVGATFKTFFQAEDGIRDETVIRKRALEDYWLPLLSFLDRKSVV